MHKAASSAELNPDFAIGFQVSVFRFSAAADLPVAWQDEQLTMGDLCTKK